MTAFEDGAACPNKLQEHAYLVGKGLLPFCFQKGYQQLQHVVTSGIEG